MAIVASAMNHIQITAEAIRFRMTTIRPTPLNRPDVNVEAMAEAALISDSPEVATALRIIATEWQRAGLDFEALGRPWTRAAAELFLNRPDLMDALDAIVLEASLLRWPNSSNKPTLTRH